jgi:hypothetical protein
MPAWSSRIADVVVWACIALAWALSCVQVWSAWIAWSRGAGIWATPGALSIIYYLPLVVLYAGAVGFASRRGLVLFAMAPVVGILALALV